MVQEVVLKKQSVVEVVELVAEQPVAQEVVVQVVVLKQQLAVEEEEEPEEELQLPLEQQLEVTVGPVVVAEHTFVAVVVVVAVE